MRRMSNEEKSARSEKLADVAAIDEEMTHSNTNEEYLKAMQLLEELYSAKATDKPIQHHVERVPSGKRGVNLLFIKAFVDFVKEKGGDARAEMEQISRCGKTGVCALTESTGLSLMESCMYIMRQNSKEFKGLFGTATTFFSYSWTCTSLTDVYESLKQVAVAELPFGYSDSYFWIDIFCASQNLLAGKYKHLEDIHGKPWKEDTDNVFKGAIETTTHVVFYCSPLMETWLAPSHHYLRDDQGQPPKEWERKGPRAITRAWCLFEVAESLQKENCKLYVALSAKDRQNLFDILTQRFDDIITIFSDTDANKAQMSKLEDRAFILGEIQKLDKGFDEINDKVKSGLRSWLADTAKYLEEGVTENALAELKNGRASLLKQQGQFVEGEKCAREALALYKKHGEESHVAKGLCNLAGVLVGQGKYNQSESLYRETLSILKKANGDDSALASALSNLAESLLAQGKYDETKALFEQAIAIWKKVYGDEHLLVATGLNNLAGLLRDQGKYDDAEPLYRETLSILKKVHGDEHPHYAAALSNLAWLLQDQGKYDEAEPLYRECLSTLKKLHGDEHPHVAIALNNLSSLMRQVGKYDQAERFAQDAVKIYRNVNGDVHPHLADGLNTLAMLWEDQGKNDQAEPLYREALAIGKKTYGDEHPNVARSLNNLAMFLEAQGKTQEAQELGQQALQICQKALGSDHPNTKNVQSKWG